MRRTIFAVFCGAVLLLASLAAVAQQPTLESVLKDMDTASANFRSAQADFTWDQYQKVVDETDTQKGTVYFRRTGKGTETQMAADISDPAKKYVLYTDSMVRIYEPKIDQVTQYNAAKNKAEVESFLVLGFGGSGHDLQKSFDVKLAGMQQVDGVNAAQLELTPKTQKGRSIFSQITLWIDPARGVSVQQKFLEPSGDYRLAKYTNIKLNQRLPDDVFKLKTTGKTRVVNPQS